MTHGELIQKLTYFRKKAETIIELTDDPPKWGKNREIVRTLYAELKSELKNEYAKYDTAKGENMASQIEERSYIPAIREAYLHMTARSGSGPSQELFQSVYDVSDYMSYWAKH